VSVIEADSVGLDMLTTSRLGAVPRTDSKFPLDKSFTLCYNLRTVKDDTQDLKLAKLIEQISTDAFWLGWNAMAQLQKKTMTEKLDYDQIKRVADFICLGALTEARKNAWVKTEKFFEKK
jgi:hypothetical protein